MLTPDLSAQGLTSAGIHGAVRAADGGSVNGATVRVENAATGFAIETVAVSDVFMVEGLEPGGPYTVTVSRIGYRPERREGIHLDLGERIELRFVLRVEAIRLDSLVVFAGELRHADPPGGGVTTFSDSLIQRLPTPDRDVYDFVRLAPLVSTSIGSQRTGASGAGANFRFNSFLIDGGEERFVAGNVSAAFNIGKSIPLDAVREYQVLVAPYDVRYGDFAGVLINTITRSGTNQLQGSAFGSWRGERLTGDPGNHDRLQYGFVLSGPVLRNRVHFLVAPEFQQMVMPAAGPYVGQPASAASALPVSEQDVARFQAILRDTYGLSAGSAGRVEMHNPLTNVFARVDAALPAWSSRLSASFSHAGADDERFSRTAPDTFSLSSYRWTLESGLRLASLRLYSDLPWRAGSQNELVVSHSTDWGDFVPDVRQPLVRVAAPGVGGGLVTLNGGTAEQAQGRYGEAWSVRVRDDLSLLLSATHLLRLGAQVERFRIERGGVVGGYGVWTFASLDAFEQGTAARYELRKPLTDADPVMTGWQYGAWLGDEWRPGPDLTLTMGVRADVLSVDGHAPYNRAVDSIFGRRTDRMPRARVHLSPRLGFAWHPFGHERDRVRAGVGVFTGRPPLGWLFPALSSYGVGIGVLRCGTLSTDAGPPPPFEPDYRAAPTACASGRPVTAGLGDVDLLDRELRMAQSLRGSLAYDRTLPWDVVATAELLMGRHVSDFVFVNMNLAGVQSVDRFGRVLYGQIDASGLAAPALRSGFSEVIDLRNTSRNYSYHATLQMEKPFAGGFSARASYTFSRVRDVQSPSRINQPGIALWADARTLSGRHEDLPIGASLNDVPHRAVTAISYTAPWRRAGTTISFYYLGESGSPFTYVAGGVGRRGDLNADGSNINDPVYVPHDASDAAEILFSGTSDEPGADNSVSAQAERVLAQQEAFEAFIEGSCLDVWRGRILARNRCREPWAHTTVASLRQALPVGGGALELEIDVFNLLNLLNRAWGLRRIAAPVLLEHVGQTTGAAGTTQPIFRFDTTRRRWITLESESAYQLQLTLRYRF